MMRSHYCIFFFYLIASYYTANVPREKPKNSRSFIIRSFLSKNRFKISPDHQEGFDDQAQMYISDASTTEQLSITFDKIKRDHNESDRKFSFILKLPSILVQEIFEYLLSEPSSIRLTSRQSRRLFDSMSFRLAWTNFPECDKKNFRSWNTNRERFKMIRLAEAGLSVSKFYSKSNERKSSLLSLKEKSLSWVLLLNVKDETSSLLAISILLKLEIIQYVDVKTLNLLNNAILVQICKEGLLSLAKEVAFYNRELFTATIGNNLCGLVLAIKHRKYSLVKFIMEAVETFQDTYIYDHSDYLTRIVGGLFDAEYWDLLAKIQKYNITNFDYRPFLKRLVDVGCVQGLEALKLQAINQPRDLPRIAASHGHLDFLKKLNDLNILNVSDKDNYFGDTAVHCAAFNGNMDCLLYLLDHLPGQSLDACDNCGLMPIHMAAQAGKCEALNEIIDRYPRYHPRGFRNWFKEIRSPLNVAVCCSQLQSSKILLDSFPELIKCRDSEGYTALHLAIENASDELLSLLIQKAPPCVIKYKNQNGDTALHLACRSGLQSKIKLLLDTKCFNEQEYDNERVTPISLLAEEIPEADLVKFRGT